MQESTRDAESPRDSTTVVESMRVGSLSNDDADAKDDA